MKLLRSVNYILINLGILIIDEHSIIIIVNPVELGTRFSISYYCYLSLIF